MEKQLSVNINTMLYVIDWWGWGTRGLGAGNARRGTRDASPSRIFAVTWDRTYRGASHSALKSKEDKSKVI
jgi:hypothetical protein